MRLFDYIYENLVKDALDTDEPEVGGSYSDDYVKKIVDKLKSAISQADKDSYVDDDAKEAIMSDLQDKLEVWKNVDKETKPSKPTPKPSEDKDKEADKQKESEDKDKESEDKQKEREKEKTEDEKAKNKQKDEKEKDDEERRKENEKQREEMKKKNEDSRLIKSRIEKLL